MGAIWRCLISTSLISITGVIEKSQVLNPSQATSLDLSNCSRCSLGRACRKCQSCFYEDSPLYSSNGYKSAKHFHRVNRFLVRGFRGVACGSAKHYRFRWFVLTSSPASYAQNLDFGAIFHRFVDWLRYYCPDFQYIVIEHFIPRKHWHIISFGSDMLPLAKMRNWWISHFSSTITGMEEIRHIEKAMFYVAGYLAGSAKFVRSWSSQGWVFRGWVGFSRKYRSQYGSYPDSDTIVNLSLLPKAKRTFEVEWLLNTGFFSGAFYPGK